ncbi:MAG: hypothetical protein PHO06_02790 [Clostridia bacterium]|nr:hypothetical protein [Clostridia bacterium]
MMIASIVALIFTEPSIVVKEMSDASWGVLQLCAELLAIYTIWMGLLEIVDKSGLGEKLAKLLSPIIKWLFRIQDKEATKYIALNISSNMLGLGNAATPTGIKAMQRLDDGSGNVTPAMIMLLIVNSTAIQLLPTTTIGLRATSGSQNPSDIIIPTLVATLITCIFGILCAKLFEKIFYKEKNKNNDKSDKIDRNNIGNQTNKETNNKNIENKTYQQKIKNNSNIKIKLINEKQGFNLKTCNENSSNHIIKNTNFKKGVNEKLNNRGKFL